MRQYQIIKSKNRVSKYTCAHMDCNEKAYRVVVCDVQGTPGFYGHCKKHFKDWVELGR